MNKIKIFIKENKLLCLFFIFFIITICLYDDNSFLFKYTVMHDEGIYWNIARKMLEGKILYKDFYDIKGPFIFFIYQLLYLISIPGTTSGVFLYDLICIAFSFYFIYKTNALFHNKIENLIILFLSFTFFIFLYFSMFGVPELLVMSLYSYLIYWLFSKKYKEDNLKNLYFITILSGIVFWLKFNLIIVPGILFLFYLVQVIVKEKKYKNLLHCFIGFMFPTIIVLIYFIKNNALNDLFQVYFFDNLGYRIDSFLGFPGCFVVFIVFSILIFILNILSLRNQNDIKWEVIIFYVCFFSLILFQFLISNRYYKYYFYPCFPFLLTFLFSFKFRNKYAIIIISFMSSLFLIVQSPFISETRGFRTFYNQENNAINDLSKILKEDDNVFSFKVSPAIFNEFGENVQEKYFFFPNHSYKQNPELWETVKNNIKNKNYDYILIETFKDGKISVSQEFYEESNYEMVQEFIFYINENYDFIEISDFKKYLHDNYISDKTLFLLKKK